MIIAIAGVPGTGKTSVASALGKQTGARVISTTEIVNDNLIKYEMDEERGVKIVDPKDLQEVITHRVRYKTIIEGMLSHLIESDLVVVLRCNPEELTKRLKEKGWNKKKIKENIEAEIIDTVTVEAIEKHSKDKVMEIDTSSNSPEEIASDIEATLERHDTKKYAIGRIDWMHKYADYLVG
jgi:adenylate kinase